ncbi:hypothetical protein P1J78_16390 [Psychromarinibacter sp. C21-152]|uniref:Uncharacterized protein n=1 Tax=Psychromarinibacter sediminicola TaxID=3033385 RepID=A0AAE3TAT1_9RHOB|nr:hypothetical protein [Psychromarinibacter sediminicola]MDF0602319.1 hypothetical protein [Psychromarinibacter sediminicola]
MTQPDAALDAARLHLKETDELLQAARAAHSRARAAFERAVKQVVEDPVDAVFNCDAPPSDHRRNHRPGRPAKIDSDRELQAFIRARIDRLTFVEIAEEVAETFPPERRVGKSAIHAWWQRIRK